MTPTQYLRAFARWWWIIVLCTAAGTILAVVVDGLSTSTYTSTSNVLVSAATTAETTSSEAYTGTLLAQQRITSYADIARSPSLAENLVDELGLDITPAELEDQIEVTTPPNTTLLTILVRDASPEQAQLIATRAAESVVETIDNLESVRGKGRPLLQAAVVGQARKAVAPTAPPGWRNPLLGAAGGLVVGLGLAVVAGRLDRRLRDESAVADVLGAPVLGVLPSYDENAAWNDAIHEFRTSIYFTHPGPDSCLCLAITSAHPLDRVPQVTSDLATALVDTGARVLLVEGNLREPKLASLLGLGDDGAAGLTEYLAGTGANGEVVKHHPQSGVDVILAGSTPGNPADLLHSRALAGVLEDAAQRYDFVLVTTPATSIGTDAVAVAARCDGVVLTVERGRTTQSQLQAARRQFERVDAPVLGAVLMS